MIAGTVFPFVFHNPFQSSFPWQTFPIVPILVREATLSSHSFIFALLNPGARATPLSMADHDLYSIQFL